MSITVITGVPGSGKTLKAVWDHVRPLVGHVEHTVDEWGRDKDIPSIIYTNINSLQVDHELIEGGGKWTQSGPDKAWAYEGNPEGLRNWHNWAKPGAKIVFDEFQKHWPPRANGAAIPPDIQTLDTHRHMGVDFILICQSLRNVDRHVLGLVDRHLHVRRVANLPLATVYEWDHASVSLMYSNSMSKSPFRYPKAAYKLYKSAELHTKQRRKLPSALWILLAAGLGLGFLAPTFANRMDERIHGKAAPKAETKAEAPGQPTTKTFINENGQEVTVSTSTTTETTPPPPGALAGLGGPAAALQPPEVAGCILVRNRCGCFDVAGKKVEKTADYCMEFSGANSEVPKQIVPDDPQPRVATDTDLEALQFIHRKT